MNGNKKGMINMENEKIFELLEKMYADLKGDINSLKKGQDEKIKTPKPLSLKV
ncbi:hypothetical protein [Clostridium sp. JN-9]|uniref:hypothetical protein n=1 Tax=Clostridium sp. JN-9 TaxID=2507159 RepID=UPI0013E898DD|nr:hypothetical protein [Clostridium sp. JN-9]